MRVRFVRAPALNGLSAYGLSLPANLKNAINAKKNAAPLPSPSSPALNPILRRIAAVTAPPAAGGSATPATPPVAILKDLKKIIASVRPPATTIADNPGAFPISTGHMGPGAEANTNPPETGTPNADPPFIQDHIVTPPPVPTATPQPPPSSTGGGSYYTDSTGTTTTTAETADAATQAAMEAAAQQAAEATPSWVLPAAGAGLLVVGLLLWKRSGTPSGRPLNGYNRRKRR